MTGLLHEGIFYVEGLLQPGIFGSFPWAIDGPEPDLWPLNFLP